MSGEAWRDERMLAWLMAGPSEVPVEPLEVAVAYARSHPRRRWSVAGIRWSIEGRIRRGWPGAPGPRHWSTALATAATTVVAVLVVSVVALLATGGSGPGGPAAPAGPPTGSPNATPSTTSTPSPTLIPSPTPSPPVGDRSCVVGTLAGTAGQVGAVDGRGAAARFSAKVSVGAFDAAGVLYVVDGGNHAIRKVTPDGEVTTWAGGLGEAGSADGPGTSARFDTPVSLAFDAAGVAYVADSGNHTIRRITPDGTVTTLAGKAGDPAYVDGTRDEARFATPFSIAVDAAGTVYVGERDGGAIRRITLDGTVTSLAGIPGVTAFDTDGTGREAGFGWPFGIAIGPGGVLYVADVRGDRSVSALRTVTADGVVATLDADWTAGSPGSLWIDPSGTLFTAAFMANTILELTPDATVRHLAGIRGVEGSADGTGDVAGFTGPLGIARDAAGTLYVGDAFNATIRTIRCP